MDRLLAIGALAALAAALPCQATGRTMQVLAPAVLGQTATFGLTHPVQAAGNLYTVLWCMPPFAGTRPCVVPGFTVQGLLRVEPANSSSAFAGVFGASGSVSHSLTISSNPSFLGMAWDLQSIDLDSASMTLALGDNELALSIVAAPPASLNMVAIAPGTFSMGSPVTPLLTAPYFNQPQSQPVHQVTISRPFWMARYEVTQAEYQAVMGNNPSFFQGAAWPNSANRPVERVNWHDAMAYCAELTASEHAAGRLPVGYQYRLPTEAEWEYCCRAGTTTEFHHGNTLFCGEANFAYSNHGNNLCGSGASPSTVGVGGYAPNAWGLHDMHGNVLEWCLDGSDGSANYPSVAVTDPHVTNGNNKVIRGGGWFFNSNLCRSAHRGSSAPTIASANVGFRVVCAPVVH